MKQRTFGEIVGLPPVVPSKALPLDIIVRSDGSEGPICDSFEDCHGNFHATEESRDESDVTIVEEILNKHIEACETYCREHDDFTEPYDHCVTESFEQWDDYVKEWIRDNYPDDFGCGMYSRFEDQLDDLVYEVCHNLNDRVLDADWEFNSNEYGCYDGDGCYLWGFDIGEQEEQIDVSCYAEFAKLHAAKRLADILDAVVCDAVVCDGCVSDYSIKRLRDNKSDYPCFEVYYCPGGRWDCIVSYDRMKQAVVSAILTICRKKP